MLNYYAKVIHLSTKSMQVIHIFKLKIEFFSTSQAFQISWNCVKVWKTRLFWTVIHQYAKLLHKNLTLHFLTILFMQKKIYKYRLGLKRAKRTQI